jgi:hypothetical protein
VSYRYPLKLLSLPSYRYRWEREDRTDKPEDKETSSGALSEAMEDMIESAQENSNYEPPAGPAQEKT